MKNFASANNFRALIAFIKSASIFQFSFSSTVSRTAQRSPRCIYSRTADRSGEFPRPTAIGRNNPCGFHWREIRDVYTLVPSLVANTRASVPAERYSASKRRTGPWPLSTRGNRASGRGCWSSRKYRLKLWSRRVRATSAVLLQRIAEHKFAFLCSYIFTSEFFNQYICMKMHIDWKRNPIIYFSCRECSGFYA